MKRWFKRVDEIKKLTKKGKLTWIPNPQGAGFKAKDKKGGEYAISKWHSTTAASNRIKRFFILTYKIPSKNGFSFKQIFEHPSDNPLRGGQDKDFCGLQSLYQIAAKRAKLTT